jgi:hypothetical protein
MISIKAAAFILIVGASLVNAGSVIDKIKGALGLGTGAENIVVPGGSGNLPNYFRVETEIVRLSNQKGIQSSGSSCDKTDECDTRVYAYLDSEKPTSSFPGALAVTAIPKIFESTDNNNPNINVLLTKDICNPKDITHLKVVARVHVTDHNKVLSDSLIDDFDCPVGGAVANNQQSANWIDSRCVAKHNPKKVQLFARNRIYRIPANECSNARPAAATSKSILG